MNKLFFVIGLIVVCGCSEKASEDSPKVSGDSVEYEAQYGEPNQALIQPCSGPQPLVKPIVRCVRKSTGAVVNNILCYNLPPVIMDVPSPSGDKEISISGGARYDYCEEGSTAVLRSSILCSSGYLLVDHACRSYANYGSYTIQKDMQFKTTGSLQMIYTIGEDIGKKESNGLKIQMIVE